MPEAVIVAATRTPIGRAFKGSLTGVRPDDLAAHAVTSALAQVPALDPSEIDDLYLGCAEPWGEHGSNMARVVAVLTGHDGLPGSTVNRFCASSVQTTRMAFHAIKAGEGDVFVSAGVEMVSRYAAFKGAGQSNDEWLNPRFDDARERTARTAVDNSPWIDPREQDGLPDVYVAMGQTAENVAHLKGVSRQAQDEWAVESQNRAEKAQANGVFAREITPVTLPDGSVMDTDDSPRAGTTLEGVSGLKPVFRETGTVTAGNACPLNDGAAALVVMSDTKAAAARADPARAGRRDRRLRPVARDHGPRPGRGQQAGARPRRDDDRRHRPRRDQRGVRRAGDPQRGRARHRPRQAQRPRRRDRARSPVRDDRCPDHHDPAQRAEHPRRPVRPRDDVRRRRPGHGDHLRARSARAFRMRFRRGRGGDSDDTSSVDAFWRWWAGGGTAEVERCIGTGDFSPVVGPLASAVAAIHPALDWELGAGSRSRHRLVVTAAGNPALRAAARRWHRAAPAESATWEYADTRQPVGEPVVLDVAGHAVRSDDVTASTWADDGRAVVDVRLAAPVLALMSRQDALRATFLLLDQVLGEEAVETWVGQILVDGHDGVPVDEGTAPGRRPPGRPPRGRRGVRRAVRPRTASPRGGSWKAPHATAACCSR